jgi:short-subunit dehydrogenase involved in D-alanine esterification of teichoic acids
MTESGKEKLDLLLEQNAERQLAKIDWQALNASISSRLNAAPKPATFKWPVLLRAAAIIAIISAITALLLLTVPLSLSRKSAVHIASVEFTHSIAQTTVQILEIPAQAEVSLSPAAANSGIAKCEIEIICRQEPSLAQNGISAETASLLCLF